jgi:hypothetical protein
MKKNFFGIIILYIFLISFNSCFADSTRKVVILPLDLPTEASSYSIYPSTLTLISADVANSLARDYKIEVVDINKAQKELTNAGLSKKYKEFIRLYKEKYVFDNNLLGTIGDTIGVENIIFVSGGFDTQKALFKPTKMSILGLPGTDRINPSYELNLMVTLVNTNNSIKLYEDNFRHDFKIENFNVPSQHFAENSVSINEIKTYSQKIARQISYQINTYLKPDQNTAANDYTVVKSTKGILSKDSRQDVTEKTKKNIDNVDTLINNKKRDYKNWVLKNI